MNRTQHPSNNQVISAPVGHDQQELPCDALPVTVVDYGGGKLGMVSFWRPTAEELQQLAAGGLVMLSVMGTMHPMVALGVEP